MRAQILLRINDKAPITIEAAELAAMPRHTVVLNNHGKQISYEGPLLRDVLKRGGFEFSNGLHGKQLASYVAALATDDYEVVFALAELDPTLTDSPIIVADKRDGGALEKDEGAVRIVAGNDKRPARSIRLLKEIDVVQLRK